ncbi:hypothetical protein SUREIYA_00320 [Serratia phage vB_SmaM-Sureiya]|nr:hypothetical protein SUREIYA_00320 [Serratia phage vB_SmaM-Sureiya]
MITLQNKLAILFANETDRSDLETANLSTRTNAIRRMLRDMITQSSALGYGDLEEGAELITEQEMTSGVPVTFDLLQVDNPLVIRSTIQRYGDVGSNYVTLNIEVLLSERKSTYLQQYYVTNLFVESVSLSRLWKRMDRIMKDIPSLVAPLLAN